MHDQGGTREQRIRVLVSGRVQGVFYRATCEREARAAGVSGWVRNCPDGRVEAVFEGDPDAVERMAAWVRRGPRKARVDDVELYDEPVQGLRDFVVRD
ncbi:MAG TPA: acylphosphatase [Yinghuangia sp.]|uniref:acylphosphatase n=1 Tax=Yinghuangia sp. YIM S10712 TaxID=3436930 RepID=UPI002C50B416|nr:acylphosphatase [Yinghuangia sp.]